MAVRPLSCLVYLNPSQIDGASGTPLEGIEGDEVYFEDGLRDVEHGSGLEADAWTSVVTPGTRPMLVIPLRDVVAATNQIAWMLRSTGTGIDSAGGNGVGLFASPPAVALVIRPRVTAIDDYWYFPRLSVNATASQIRVTWARNTKRFEGMGLVLYPRRSADGTKQAWKQGTYAALNTAYGLPV